MGGIAFKDKVRRIKKDEINETLNFVAERIGVEPEYVKHNVLGSAMTSETAGDLDLNCSIQTMDIDSLYERLVENIGSENVKDFRKTHQIFSCFPIKGKSENGFVQVDFMFGDYEWQKFSYYSPGAKSKYKGLFRTELIKALVAFNSDWVGVENDVIVARVGPTFFHDRGIIWRYRYLPFRKDNKGRTKTFKVVDTYEEFKQLFPTAPKASNSVINTPDGVRDLVFSPQTHLDAFESYETLIGEIKANYCESDFYKILDLFFDRLNSLNVTIPIEIKNEIFTTVGNKNQTTRSRDKRENL